MKKQQDNYRQKQMSKWKTKVRSNVVVIREFTHKLAENSEEGSGGYGPSFSSLFFFPSFPGWLHVRWHNSNKQQWDKKKGKVEMGSRGWMMHFNIKFENLMMYYSVHKAAKWGIFYAVYFFTMDSGGT